MKIHQFTRSKWLTDKSKRKGRGNGSWKWNYSGKWLKWQKARSGFSMKPFFEWGQTSIVQRIPKAKWFKRHYKLVTEYSVINLSKLQDDVRILDGMEITKAVLKDLWYIKNESLLVKILWDWDLTKKLTFTNIDKFSKSAEEKIANPWKSKSKTNFKVYKKIEKAPKKATKKVVKSVEKKVIEKKVVEKKETIKVTAPKTTKTPVKKTTTTKTTPKTKATAEKKAPANKK